MEHKEYPRMWLFIRYFCVFFDYIGDKRKPLYGASGWWIGFRTPLISICLYYKYPDYVSPRLVSGMKIHCIPSSWKFKLKLGDMLYRYQCNLVRYK
jgi:hypothetical protein